MTKEGLGILIVEDDTVSARVLADLLRIHISNFPDMTIEVVSSCEEAEKRIFSREYHAILLDLRVDDSEGIETFGRIKHVAPSIPIKILTGTVDNDEIMCIRESLGVDDDIFIKPDISGAIIALREAVNQYVRSSFP